MERDRGNGRSSPLHSASAPLSFERYTPRRPEEERTVAQRFCDVSDYLFRVRVQMRYGHLSRAPLRLLRLQVLPELAECDWIVRGPDPWDPFLLRRIARRHASLQVLRDAIDLRALLFRSLPDIPAAHLRLFRQQANRPRELVLAGVTHRNDHSARDVHSLTMRAKILGFRFLMEDDWLRNLLDED